MKRGFVFTCIVLFFSLSSFTFYAQGIVDDVLSYTNQFRRSKRLDALIMLTELNAIAQKHSEDMAKGRVGFGHGGFNRRFALARKKIKNLKSFAENVAYGAKSGKEAVNMWKNSPGHRRNMLGHYKYVGIGTAKDRQGRIYYTQVFAN